jgi:aspartyl-tRNA(Asn)/glutamyl-tRNA(Gln) amidotransferase subunit B
VIYETKRQVALLESGQKVAQETRGWDEAKQETFSQRSKEDSHDYRYFPDPDLPKLKLSEVADLREEVLRLDMKETPGGKRERFKKDFGIKDSDVEFYVLNPALGGLFEAAAPFIQDKKDLQLLSNYIVSDITGFKEKGLAINPKNLAALVSMFVSGEVSSRGVKDILSKMIESGEEPETIAKREGLYQKSDEGELLKVVAEIISKNESAVLEYKSGKVSALQFLVGQGMKATGGSANPQLLRSLFEGSLK